MSSEEPHIPIETNTTTLSLAIRLVDAYTGETLPSRQLPPGAYTGDPLLLRRLPPGAIRKRKRRRTKRRDFEGVPSVSVSGVDIAPVVNPSGFLLFFDEDLSRDRGRVDVEVTGGGRYVDTQRVVDLSELDSQNPVETIELQPLPGYRFPAGATLLRGHVSVVDGDAEAEVDPRKFGEENVTLTIEGLGRTTETVAGGEFVLFVTGITAGEVSDEGLIWGNGGPTRLRVKHDEHGTTSIPVEIHEGRTRCYQLWYDKDGEMTYRKCEAED